MKKSFVFILLLSVICFNQVNAQVSHLLKSVKKSVTEEITGKPAKSNGSGSGSSTSAGSGSSSGSIASTGLGNSTGSNTSTGSGSSSGNSSNKVAEAKSVEPEPLCACTQAATIMEIGKYKIDYTELSINILDDGSVLVKDVEKNNYYIVKKGVTEGPYKKGDAAIAGFQSDNKDDNEIEEQDIPIRYSNYITKSGEKLLITFNGKKYGPYSVISKFTVSKLKDKFVAVVTENMIMTPEFIKKYEDLGKNLKTDQEKMQLSIKMSEEIQQKTDKYGPQSDGPIYVTNIPGASFNKELIFGVRFYNNIKYDEIVTESGSKIYDYKGKELVSFDYSECSAESIFISSDNSQYACFSEGALSFSNNKKLAELFNPSLLKEEGKIYLAYMYYSPKNNAIMQCKIPF